MIYVMPFMVGVRYAALNMTAAKQGGDGYRRRVSDMIEKWKFYPTFLLRS